MFFTQEDYRKIEKWLLSNSIKDTEFVEASAPLQGNETLAFVQKGKNVKVSLKDLIDQIFLLGVSDFLNISDKYKENYISLNQAIALVPNKSRKIGQVITFLNQEGVWKIYQFQGTKVNQWNNTTLWIDLIQQIQGLDIIDSEDIIPKISATNQTSLLLADKSYNPDDFSGLGRVYLRKNMQKVINPNTGMYYTTNLLTQAMVSKENTIYIIQYDYNLNNQTITIPEGCILDMKGGSVTNGTINCVDTIIISTDASKLDVTLTGTYRFDSEKLVTSNTEDINISQSVNRKSHTISAMLADRDTANGMGYVILRKDKSFKEQIAQENTIYEIRYDFTLNEDITVPANCVLKFDGGSIKAATGATPTLAFDDTWLGGKVSINAPTTGSIANEDAYMWWFNDNIDLWHTFINNVTGVIRYEYSSGEYTTTVPVNKNVVKQIIIEGNGAVVKYSHTVTNERLMQIQPIDTTETVYNITAAVSPNDESITLDSVTGINEGDILALKDNATASYNPERKYQQGEFIFVKKIDDNDITPNHRIYGNYKNTGNLTATKFSLIDVTIRNLNLKQIDTIAMASEVYTYGLMIDKAKATIENLSINGFVQCFILKYSVYSRIEDCEMVANYAVFSGTDNYGLVLGNNQNLTVCGGRYEGGNHGITNGGNYAGNLAIVNRFVTISDVQAMSNKFDYGIDAHGVSESFIVKGCTTNGIGLSGDKHTIINNSVQNKSTNNKSGYIFVRGITLNHRIEDNRCGMIEVETIKYNSSYNTDWSHWTPSTTEENLIITGNIVGEYISIHSNTTSTQYPNIANVHCFVQDNVIKEVLCDLYNKLETFNPNNAGVIELIGNRLNICSNGNLYASKVIFKNNYISSTLTYKNIRSNDIVISSNLFVAAGTSYIIRIYQAKTIIIEDNTFYDCQDPLRIESAVTGADITVTGNIAKNSPARLARILYCDNSTSNTLTLYCADNILPSERGIAVNGAARLVYKNNVWLDRVVKPYAAVVKSEVNLDAKTGVGPMADAPQVGIDAGFTWYDTDSNKVKVYKPTAGSQAALYSVTGDNVTRIESNPLQEGKAYRLTYHRDGLTFCAFAKTTNQAEADMLVIDAKNYYGNRSVKDFIAPSRTEYPYLYMKNNLGPNGSAIKFEFYNLNTYVEPITTMLSGDTASRPVTTINSLYQSYFDTTIGKVVMSNYISEATAVVSENIVPSVSKFGCHAISSYTSASQTALLQTGKLANLRISRGSYGTFLFSKKNITIDLDMDKIDLLDPTDTTNNPDGLAKDDLLIIYDREGGGDNSVYRLFNVPDITVYTYIYIKLSISLANTGFILYDASFAWSDMNGYTPAKNSGATADRPTLTSTDAGFQFWDTNLGKMIAWSGTAWVNLDGTPLT